MQTTPVNAWIVTDGAAGNLRQAEALAAAMELDARTITTSLRAPWSWLAPRRLPGAPFALARAARTVMAPPWPEVAIGCGRSAAWLTRELRARSEGACYCVQILDPRIDPRHWDVVIAPAHDGLAGANVLTAFGALNPIDDAWLAQARAVFSAFAALPRPRVALLIGGPRRGIAFDERLSQRLLACVLAVAQGGSVLATSSRRTPSAFAARLRDALAGFPGVFWHGDGSNPYAGLLSWADRIVVTPDSVNMLSEACAVGVPVHTTTAAPLPEKIARFHAALCARGLLGDPGAPRARVPPLRETQAIAAQLRARIAARARR